MIDLKRYQLDNGLRVILHEDPSTPLATINLLYDVGSRDENPERTGFAHLFEHLMFGGTQRFPEYDAIAQMAGATNNAFTSADITNYYLTLPSDNLEVGLMLEADRMRSLDLSEKALEVQQKVVIEEFKQRYINQPYGDIWLNILPLAYSKHPYLWPTIGKSFEHIQEATLNDVQAFYDRYYQPNNAILSISGGINSDRIIGLIEKHFGSIPAGPIQERKLPVEPAQKEKKTLRLVRSVPQHAFYKVYHMPGRSHDYYYTADVLSDLLGRGNSSRIHRKLIQDKEIFTRASCYIMGTRDPGLFILNGMLSPGVNFDQAEEGINELLKEVCAEVAEHKELDKVKRKVESSWLFGQVKHADMAFNLAYFELLGDARRINHVLEDYENVTSADLRDFAIEHFVESNASALYYQSK
jgi:zinc protease